mgnify:CR=1 FL=1|tara:strand:- start:392 stop:622 length:231 start_codon:yes stop_codon:yes gene_type:complete
MTTQQAEFVKIVVDELAILDYVYIAKSFYKKFGLTEYCKGPRLLHDPERLERQEVYSAREGEILYNKALEILNNGS